MRTKLEPAGIEKKQAKVREWSYGARETIGEARFLRTWPAGYVLDKNFDRSFEDDERIPLSAVPL